MQGQKVVIIGGVAGGSSAATRIRRLDESANIVMLERTPYVSFANCGMPYYIGQEIRDRSNLLITSEEKMHQSYNLDVRASVEVKKIIPQEKKISVKDLKKNQIYELNYDKLIIATGAKPVKPPISGSDLAGVFGLRGLEDMDAIYEESRKYSKSVVLIGSGYIGLEMAENFRKRGLSVTVVELQDQVLPYLDKEMSYPLEKEIKRNGVNLLLSETATEIKRHTEGEMEVILKSGNRVSGQFVVLGVGVTPDNFLAKDCGLELGQKGGIIVNQHMQTSNPHIYAVGDVVETIDIITKQRVHIPLAGPANYQGRVAANHICGLRNKESYYEGVQATSIVKCFALTIATSGSSEKILKKTNMDFRKMYLRPPHHVEYYPGASFVHFKYLFDPKEGTIYGVQIVGSTDSAVDKFVDIVATAIRTRLTVYDLQKLELAYSPQYGAAKHPINMAGYVGAGIIEQDQQFIYADELKELLGSEKRPFLIDLRSSEAHQKRSIPTSVNIPISSLRSRVKEIPRDKDVVVFCRQGKDSHNAHKFLTQKGYSCKNLSGGIDTWEINGFEIKSKQQEASH